jgi:GTP cyclohydrolase IB
MDSALTSPTTHLLDVQGLADTRGIALQQAGVKGVEMPITLLQKDGNTQVVAASATMSVGLPATDKGTHMSRFVLQLSEWSKDKVLSLNLREFLEETKARLSASSARLALDFKYYAFKASPVTDNGAMMGYNCNFTGQLQANGQYRLVLGLTLPVATLCPCSKAISKYGAHNQRALIHLQLLLDTDTEAHPIVWIEDMITTMDECASCPVYPVLKREDEKYVTERAYENPRFVEDAIREAIARLQTYPGIKGFAIEVEALESIHAHNAWAAHSHNME